MADVKWIKIVTDIFDDEKILLIESMPEADGIIVIWFKLLCLAGRQNNGGVFLMNGRIAYTDEMFATIFRRPLNTVRLALKTFEAYGMIEIINDTVTIPNWGKHQKLDALEAKTQYMREYMRDYRAKQRALADGKDNGKTNSNANVSVVDKNREDKNREDKNREEEPKRKRFAAPTVDEVDGYAKEKGYTGFCAERFVDYYESKGWVVGKSPMKDWKAAVRGWASRDRSGKPNNPALDYQQREYKADNSGKVLNLETGEWEAIT
jgi:predicted phage replisome organizer